MAICTPFFLVGKPEQIERARRYIHVDGHAIKRATNRAVRRKTRRAHDLEDAPRQGEYRGWVL